MGAVGAVWAFAIHIVRFSYKIPPLWLAFDRALGMQLTVILIPRDGHMHQRFDVMLGFG